MTEHRLAWDDIVTDCNGNGQWDVRDIAFESHPVRFAGPLVQDAGLFRWA